MTAKLIDRNVDAAEKKNRDRRYPINRFARCDPPFQGFDIGLCNSLYIMSVVGKVKVRIDLTSKNLKNEI